MAGELTIRPATLADVARIAGYNVALAAESEDRPLDRATVEAGVRRLLADPAKGFYLVAEAAGGCAGQLMVTFEWSDWRNGLIWWLQSVYVAPEARRQGVFRALVGELEARARREQDVVALRLYVERDNATAKRTYDTLGFAATGYDVMERPLATGPDSTC